MREQARGNDDDAAEDNRDARAEVTVGARVRVHPATDTEEFGVIVEDFGEDIGYAVDIGGHRIAGPARRWAVSLDTGSLVFLDSDQLAVE